jgi:hypothetical protein
MPNKQVAEKDWKHEVAVKKVEKALKVPDNVLDEVKGIKGKIYSQMKKEKVDCPVVGMERPFLACFVCPNFRSRIRGIVYCKGDPL